MGWNATWQQFKGAEYWKDSMVLKKGIVAQRHVRNGWMKTDVVD